MNFTDSRTADFDRERRFRRDDPRANEMYQAYLRGLTMTEVGYLYGVSTERVRQLFFWNGLPRRQRGWRPPTNA